MNEIPFSYYFYIEISNPKTGTLSCCNLKSTFSTKMKKIRNAFFGLGSP